MKTPTYLLLSLALLAAMLLPSASRSAGQAPRPAVLDHTVWKGGESIDYRVHYGWITAGEANMHVYPTLSKHNNNPCWKIEIVGKTTGLFDKTLSIRDSWGTLMDTTHLIPRHGWRNIEEGNYRRYETIYYDYEKNKASLHVKNKDEVKELKLVKGMQDIVSGYYFLRQIDFKKMPIGKIITMDALFEDKTYNFQVRYQGKEKIKTKFGRINAIKLIPIMPENDLFDGENSIQFYVSDDANRIPLKIRAELFVGAVELDIKDYRGLKNPLVFDK